MSWYLVVSFSNIKQYKSIPLRDSAMATNFLGRGLNILNIGKCDVIKVFLSMKCLVVGGSLLWVVSYRFLVVRLKPIKRLKKAKVE